MEIVRVEDAIKYMEEKQSQTRSFRETAICLLILSILDNTKKSETENEASDKPVEIKNKSKRKVAVVNQEFEDAVNDMQRFNKKK